MRTIDTHKVNPANDTIDITVVDKPGSGGANHAYFITGVDFEANPSDHAALDFARVNDAEGMVILFQNGPIPEAGVNGVTHEALLAIIADRLQCFQAGPFANEFNAVALQHVEAAQAALLSRTRSRMARGVEGTHQV